MKDQEADIRRLVNEYFQDAEKTALWMMTQIPFFGLLSPAQMLACGRAETLKEFIHNAKELIK